MQTRSKKNIQLGCMHWRLEKAFKESKLSQKEFEEKIEMIEVIFPNLNLKDYSMEPWLLRNLISRLNQVVQRVVLLQEWIPELNISQLMEEKSVQCIGILLIPDEKFQRIPDLTKQIQLALNSERDVNIAEMVMCQPMFLLCDPDTVEDRVQFLISLDKNINVMEKVERNPSLLTMSSNDVILCSSWNKNTDQFYGRPPLPP